MNTEGIGILTSTKIEGAICEKLDNGMYNCILEEISGGVETKLFQIYDWIMSNFWFLDSLILIIIIGLLLFLTIKGFNNKNYDFLRKVIYFLILLLIIILALGINSIGLSLGFINILN